MNGHPVSGPQPLRDEPLRQPVGRLVPLPVGHGMVVAVDSSLFRHPRRLGVQQAA